MSLKSEIASRRKRQRHKASCQLENAGRPVVCTISGHFVNKRSAVVLGEYGASVLVALTTGAQLWLPRRLLQLVDTETGWL